MPSTGHPGKSLAALLLTFVITLMTMAHAANTAMPPRLVPEEPAASRILPRWTGDEQCKRR
jgi:hypothetical protein